MADVMCPLSFEDLDALLADEQLPSELAAVFGDFQLLPKVPLHLAHLVRAPEAGERGKVGPEGAASRGRLIPFGRRPGERSTAD